MKKLIVASIIFFFLLLIGLGIGYLIYPVKAVLGPISFGMLTSIAAVIITEGLLAWIFEN